MLLTQRNNSLTIGNCALCAAFTKRHCTVIPLRYRAQQSSSLLQLVEASHV